MRSPVSLLLYDSRPGRLLFSRISPYSDPFAKLAGSPREEYLPWSELSAVTGMDSQGKALIYMEQGGESSVNYETRFYTNGASRVLGPGLPLAISPDGRRVASLLFSPPALVLHPTGPGQSKKVDLQGLEPAGAAWFPDGARLLLKARKGEGFQHFVLPLDGSPPIELTPPGFASPLYGLLGISPDGKTACLPNAEGRLVLWPIDGGEPRTLPGVHSDESLAGWSADGNHIYLYKLGTIPSPVTKYNLRTGERQIIHHLGESAAADGLAGQTLIYTALVSPDGSAYAYHRYHTWSSLHVAEALPLPAGK